MDWSICTLTSRGTRICPGGTEYFIRNVYPPIQELQPKVLAVVIIFTLCLVVGICGNASVLTLIYGMIKGIQPKNSSRTGHLPNSQRSTDNTILYIAALCVVDFLMSLSLPPAILDSIIGFWMFGTPICKLHHIFGSVGRIVSTFIITAMSFDRWVAVCHPYKRKFRSRRFVLCTIFALWLIAFLLLLPMLTYARANEILLHQLRQPDPALGITNITRVRVYKCSDMLPPLVFYWFTSSTFFLGYLVPLILIVYFNYCLIRKLYKHTKQLRSGIPLRRITIYTILIAALYFLCWTPYWCSVLYAIWMSIFTGDKPTSELVLFIIYCVHLLPYLGSASNWILYGLLNTQLQRRQHEPSTSITTAIHTNIPPDEANSLFNENDTHQNSNLINCWKHSGIPNGHSNIAKAMGRKSKRQTSSADSKEDLLLLDTNRPSKRKSISLCNNENNKIINGTDFISNKNNLQQQSFISSPSYSSELEQTPNEEEGDQQL
uniref:G-protein coupled receptors family 1 profile domain-containing protein n=4 Tax=Meloidogyne TaxID=189290 RepID=A0A914NIP3_MELIC